MTRKLVEHKDKENADKEFYRLYADTFFDGAYRHSAALRAIEMSAESGPMSQDQLLDCCYHAGSAVELFIDGVLALDSNLDILWKNKKPEDMEYFTLPFHDAYRYQYKVQEGRMPNALHGIIGRQTRQISEIRKELERGAETCLFPENSDRKAILTWLENLSNLRNKAIHANTLVGGDEDAACRFNVFREYVRRTFKQTDAAYKALVVSSKQSPFAGAEKRLFQRWYIEARERFVNAEREDSSAESRRLEKERERIERRWSHFEDLHGKRHTRREIGIRKCPICGSRTTWSKFEEPYYTFWMGVPNNSASALYVPEEIHLECMCCSAKDYEEMHRTRLEIKHYEALCGPLREE